MIIVEDFDDGPQEVGAQRHVVDERDRVIEWSLSALQASLLFALI